MKKNLKIISLIISLVAGVAIYYHSGKLNLNNNIELKQVPLNISSLNVSNTSIWNIKTESNFVCFSIVFKNEGGRSFYKTPGLLDLTLNTVLEGAGKYNNIELKKVLTDNSISISWDYTKDDLIVSCSCLEKYFDITIDLLCDILAKSHFNNENLEITKQNIIVSINQSLFSPWNRASEKLNDMLFSKDHPYSSSYSLVLKKLPTYTRKDVLKCYDQLFSTKNAEITIVSNLTNSKIRNEFLKLFNSLGVKKNNFHKVEQSNINIKPGITHVELDNPQSSVFFLFPNVNKNSKDYFAASIANSIFGEVGLISRLSKSVRDKNGLVYRIQSNLNNFDLCSYILGNSDTRPENVEEVIRIIKSEAKNIYENGITQEELDLAKAKKFSQNIFDSNLSILNFILKIRNMEIADISEVNQILDNYKNLSLNDVNKVIKKLFNPKNLMFVDCGKSISKGVSK